MEYGERILQKGLNGDDVAELQIRLAGFRGTVPDGGFGSGTELQVVTFQRDYMKMQTPTGLVDGDTLRAIDKFADDFPINFSDLKCPCGTCGGFGQGKFKGLYVTGKPKVEAFYRYEYPGIHRMILWAARALFFYVPGEKFNFNSCYRCSIDNINHQRSSTNHHGKAVDIDTVLKPGEDKKDDMEKCNALRGKLVETANAQIGWLATNRKSLEPADIAPTWVHYDVRSYERKYLDDKFFCTTLKDLDNRKPIKV
jgi:hypothetical protein